MRKIEVSYTSQSDPYRELYKMSKSQLIGIIKEDDNTIERLRSRK